MGTQVATERGNTVAPPKAQGATNHHPKGLGEITIQGHAYAIDIDELSDRFPHQPTKTFATATATPGSHPYPRLAQVS